MNLSTLFILLSCLHLYTTIQHQYDEYLSYFLCSFSIGDMEQEYYDKYICKSVREFNFDRQSPKYRKFDFCEEHSGNTCCLNKDVRHIKNKVFKIRDESYHLSTKCYDITKQIFCSTCDGDIGIHKKNGICEDLCNTWYDLCHKDYFMIRPDKDNNLDFPNADDDISLAIKLIDIVADPLEFCFRMEFPVYEDPFCYNGVPTASIINLNQKSAWSVFSKPKNKVPLTWSLQQIFIFFTRNTEIIGNYLIGLVIVFIVIFAAYEYNQWQMKMIQEQTEISKKIYQIEQRKKLKQKLKEELKQLNLQENVKQHNKSD